MTLTLGQARIYIRLGETLLRNRSDPPDNTELLLFASHEHKEAWKHGSCFRVVEEIISGAGFLYREAQIKMFSYLVITSNCFL